MISAATAAIVLSADFTAGVDDVDVDDDGGDDDDGEAATAALRGENLLQQVVVSTGWCSAHFHTRVQRRHSVQRIRSLVELVGATKECGRIDKSERNAPVLSAGHPGRHENGESVAFFFFNAIKLVYVLAPGDTFLGHIILMSIGRKTNRRRAQTF